MNTRKRKTFRTHERGIGKQEWNNANTYTHATNIADEQQKKTDQRRHNHAKNQFFSYGERVCAYTCK